MRGYRRTRKKRRKTLANASLISAAILLMVYLLLSYSERGDISVEIPTGATTTEIINLLKDKDIIHSQHLFKTYIRLKDITPNFKAGVHTLNYAMGYAEIIHALSEPGEDLGHISVTIPEGYEIRQIVDRLEENGVINREEFIDEMQNGIFSYAFLEELPARESRLEGYLFPDTYYFEKGMSAHAVIDKMLRRFDEVFTEDCAKRASALGYSPDQIITLASIIEREAAGDEDRALISSVFHNRLNGLGETKLLDSCATVQYILKERKKVLSTGDTKIDSPYNTYKYPGLPVGPIASPGKASIRAALYPDETAYLYFRYDENKGKHIFSKTLQEHINAGKGQ